GGIDIDATPTEGVEIGETEGVVETLVNIIPEDPIAAFTEGDILQIIFFAIFVGLAFTLVGKKADSVYHFFVGLVVIMYNITGIVMQFAPIGILGLVAPIIGEYGPAVLLPLLKVIIAVAIAGVIHAIVVYALAVKTFANMNPVKFF